MAVKHSEDILEGSSRETIWNSNKKRMMTDGLYYKTPNRQWKLEE